MALFLVVAKLATRQYGLVTVKQLHDLGLSDCQIQWMVRRGFVVRVRRQVYRLVGVPESWEQAVLAAVLGAGDGAVVSHTTAAAAWNLRHCDRDTAGLHLTSARLVRIAGVTCHRSHLVDADRSLVRAIPITSPERTIVDWATMRGEISATQLSQCVDDALRRQLVGLERLRRLTSRLTLQGGRYLEPVHRVLAERLPGYRPDDSDFETEMNALWERLGLPTAHRQYRVCVDGHTYRLDRAIVDRKVAIEWDSDRFHSYPSDRDYDSLRRSRLIGAGWLVIPVTANTKPDVLAQAVRRACQDRAG